MVVTIGLTIASDLVRDWCKFAGPLIEQSEVIPMQWILSLEFPYLTGHHVLPDIPNNYCTGVNRQDTLMLSSQWQPKEGLYPDIRQ